MLVQAVLVKILGMFVHKHEVLRVIHGSVQHCDQIVLDMANKKQKIQNSPKQATVKKFKSIPFKTITVRKAGRIRIQPDILWPCSRHQQSL